MPLRKLKIVQLSKVYSSNGGVGTYLLSLCQALEADDHKVAVIHADPNAPLPPTGISSQFYVKGFDHFTDDINSRKSASEVLKVLETIKPDIVHIQANNNFLLEREIRRRFSAIKTLHVYDFCPSGNKFHHALRRVCHYSTSSLCLLRMGYKRCLLSKRISLIWRQYQRCVKAKQNNANYSKLIVASEYVKQQAVANGYPENQIKVLPYFTELAVLSLVSDDGEKKQSESSKKIILFVGRIMREKGLDQLLRVFSLLHTSSSLVVYGDGMDLNRVKQLVCRLGLDGRIKFAGWVDAEQHFQFYREASVVVVPSVWPEPFGIVGIEAMSCGKPVVAFNVGGIPEWLEDGVTGFLIRPYDIKQMANKINYLLEHPAVAYEMGLRGRKRVEVDFNKEEHVKKLLEIYREVINLKIYA